MKVVTGAGALALLAVLTACTGADDSAEPDPTRSTTTEPATEESTGPPESTESTEEPEPEPRELTLAMSGDVLLHSGTWEVAQADAARAGSTGLDFTPMFAGVEDAVSSVDSAICHIETPLATPTGPFASYPVFNAPPQVVRGLLANGYDVCSTASNHSVDQGGDGLVRTLGTLDRLGMPHFGTALTRQDRQTPFVTEIDGVQVGLLNYTYGTNGIPVPSDMPWSVPIIDPVGPAGPEQIVAEAARARAAGAEVVVVGLHFGTEYFTEPDAFQQTVVEQITRSADIDLVYGHHAHVPQPFDKVNGTWVAYGLGNFIAQQETSMPDTYRGITARFTLSEKASGRFEVSDAAYLPTLITPYVAGDPRMRVLDVPAALRDRGTDPALVPSLEATLTEVTAAAELLGADRFGLHLWRSWAD